MSTLRTIAIVLLAVGLIGLIVPGIPGGEFIRYAIILGVIVFVAELLTSRKAV